MRRAAFLAATAVTLAAVPYDAAVHPASAVEREVDVARLVEGFPGVVGIFSRTLAPGPPAVSVRGDETFAAASVIKLAIMLTAFRDFDAGRAHPGDWVTLRESDIIGGSPVFSDADPGDRHRVISLIDAMIQYSDNTAANTLITTFGFAAINAAMADAGMTGTHLKRHFADVVPAWMPNLNVTTPHDIGMLLYEIERGAHEGLDTVARSASCRAMIEIMLGQQYRDMIPAGIRRGVPVANKTGEVDGERNDAAIVDPFGDNPYVLVVLARDVGDDGPTRAAIAGIARRVDGVLGAS